MIATRRAGPHPAHDRARPARQARSAHDPALYGRV